MANETTIRANIEVTGLSDLERAKSLLESLKTGMSGLGNSSMSSFSDGLTKAAESANKLKESLTSIRDVGNSSSDIGNGLAKGITEAADKAESLKAKLKDIDDVAGKDRTNNAMSESLNKAREDATKLTDTYKDVASAQRSMAETSRKVGDINRDSFRNTQRGYREQQESIRATQQAQREQIQEAPREEKPEGKFKSAVKEAFGMYTLGQLGANAVMSVADKIHDTITGGWDTIKQQSAASAQWETYTDSARQGVEQSQRLQQMALAYGQDYSLTNESARQIYMGLEGSNRVARTNRLTQDVLKAIDAEGMSDFDAERFTKFGIGNAFDTGKITQTNLNQMSNYAPQLKDAWVKSLREAGKKVKDYGDVRNLAHTGKLHSEDLERALNYAGSHEWRDASKNLLSTIPGMLRVLNTGSKQVVGQFEKSFMEPLGKAMEPYAKRMSDWFTSGDGKQVATNFGRQMSQYTTKGLQIGMRAFKGLATIQNQLKPFEGTFAKGFVNEIEAIKRTLTDAGNAIKNIFDSIKNAIPKGIKDRFGDIGKALSNGAGKITAFLMALRGLSKVPFFGKNLAQKLVTPMSGIAKRIPIIGGGLNTAIEKITGVRGNDAAADKMMSAANTMQSAANTISNTATKKSAKDSLNGDNGTGGLEGKAESVAGKSFVDRLAASRFGGGIDKLFLKGAGLAEKGGIRGLIGKGMMWGASHFGSLSLKGAGLLDRVAPRLSGLTKFIGKGAPGLNAVLGGIDAVSAIHGKKFGSNGWNAGIGKGTGEAVGGTLGMALGVPLDPFTGGLASITLGTAGSWAGGKGGSWIGDRWNNIKQQIGKFFANPIRTMENWNRPFKGIEKPIQAAMYNGGSMFKTIPGAGKLGTAMQLMAHPIQGMEKIQSGFGKVQRFFDGLSSKTDSFGKSMGKIPGLSGLGSLVRGIAHPLQSLRSIGNDLKGPFNSIKNFGTGLSKGIKTFGGDLFKGFQNKLFTGKWGSGLFNNLKMPKLHFDNPFKNFKMPHFNLSNPFKGFKMPHLDLKNPFKGWKMPHFRLPHFNLSKFKNPFKGWKIPGMSSLVNGIKKMFHGSDQTNKKTKSAGKSADSAGKKMDSMGKKGTSAWNKLKDGAKKAGRGIKGAFSKISKNSGLKKLGSSIKSGMKRALNSAKSGVKGIGRAMKSGFKGVSKAPKSAMRSLARAVKSGMKRARTAAKSGTKGIGRAMKSGLKSASRSARTAMRGIAKAVRSGMRRARSAARSGSRGIGRAIKSGLKSASRSARSAMRGVARAVKSGMRRARSAARSGSRGIGRAIRSGLRSASRGARSAMRGIATAVRSGMRRARSAARSGARGIGNAIRSGLRRASSGARSAMNRVASAVRSGMNRARSAARSGANGIANAVRSGLNRMASAARSATSRVASAIRSGLNQAKSAATSAANGMANAIKSGFDKAVSAAQSATSRIASSMSQIGSAATAAAGKVQALASAINSLHSKTVTITVNVSKHGKVAAGTPGAVSAFTNHLAKGTPFFRNGNSSLSAGRGWASNGGTKGGMYLVNDAKGADYVEAFRLKNGLTGLFPKKRNLMVPLPEGTQVLNAKDTKRMFPRLEHGTRSFDKGSHGRKSQGINVHNNFNITVNSKGGKVNPAKIAKRVAEEIGDRMNQLFAQLEV